MKNLKIKFGLFSLLAILTVSVFLTSCEQTEVVSSNIDQYQEQTTFNSDGTKKYVLPKGIDENEEDIFAYIQSMSQATSSKLAENFRIASFLADENTFEAIWEDMSYGQHLSDINLGNYLTKSQLTTLKYYSPNLNARSVNCRWGACSFLSQYNGGWCNYICYWLCFNENGTFMYVSDSQTFVRPC